MCRTHIPLDSTLLIVDGIPAVDINSKWYGETHVGMPTPEAVRALYELIGENSQAFVFAHERYGLRNANSTAEALQNRHFNLMLERAFGENPPSFHVELGWPRLFRSSKGLQRPVPHGIYGYQRTRMVGREETPTLITLFSEFYWNDFYDEIGVRTTSEFRYQEHDITDAYMLRGIVRTLQTHLGLLRFTKRTPGAPESIKALLGDADLASRYYQRVALITWIDARPVVSAFVDVNDYTGHVLCLHDSYACEDYPNCAEIR
jgi:hypothetical protein